MDMSQKGSTPVQGKAQQGRLKCERCKEENHVTRNCDSYWRWREQELRKELKELKEKAKGEKGAQCNL